MVPEIVPAHGIGKPGTPGRRCHPDIIIVQKNAVFVYSFQCTLYQAPLPDILLLSDVNYESAIFDELLNVLKYFLQHKVPIIISTPQRLVAKQFINSLLPYSSQQWNGEVVWNGKETGVSVFVLER